MRKKADVSDSMLVPVDLTAGVQRVQYLLIYCYYY